MAPRTIGPTVVRSTVFVVAMSLLAACGADEGSSAGSQDGRGEGAAGSNGDVPTVDIGMPIPTSGGGAAIGHRFTRGSEMAIEELNEEANGSMTFEGHIEDSECTPDAAATAALNLTLQEEVDVLIGELCSSATLAIKDLAEDEGVPLIVPDSSALAITGPESEWTFRIIPHEQHQHEALARVATDYYGHESFAVLYEQTDSGVGARDAFIPEAERQGGQIVLDEAFDRTATDFTPLVQRVARSGAEALHLTVLIDPGVRFVQTMEEQGLDIPVFSSIWFAYPLFEDTAGSAANNNIRQLFYINASSRPEALEFTERYDERFPDAEVPDFNHAQFYAAVKLAGWAAMECGADRTSIRDCLNDVEDFPSPIGPITFNDEGQVIPTADSLIHIETQNGDVEVLDERGDFNSDVIYGW